LGADEKRSKLSRALAEGTWVSKSLPSRKPLDCIALQLVQIHVLYHGVPQVVSV
jgi:hypothetical protein